MPIEQSSKVNYFDIYASYLSFVYECHWILQIKKRGSGIFLDPTLCISHNNKKITDLLFFTKWFKIKGNRQNIKAIDGIKQYTVTWYPCYVRFQWREGKAYDKKEGKEYFQSKNLYNSMVFVFLYHVWCICERTKVCIKSD